MKSNIAAILLILSSMSLYGTPEEEDIIDNPLYFSEWDSCFIVTQDKRNPNSWIKLKNGGEIKKLMISQNLKKVYFRDCGGEKKWRKISKNID